MQIAIELKEREIDNLKLMLRSVKDSPTVPRTPAGRHSSPGLRGSRPPRGSGSRSTSTPPPSLPHSPATPYPLYGSSTYSDLSPEAEGEPITGGKALFQNGSHSKPQRKSSLLEPTFASKQQKYTPPQDPSASGDDKESLNFVESLKSPITPESPTPAVPPPVVSGSYLKSTANVVATSRAHDAMVRHQVHYFIILYCIVLYYLLLSGVTGNLLFSGTHEQETGERCHCIHHPPSQARRRLEEVDEASFYACFLPLDMTVQITL
jgi:hypothetical protein